MQHRATEEHVNMKKYAAGITLLGLFCLFGCQSSDPKERVVVADIAITDITVIDALRGVRVNQTVWLKGDEIVGVTSDFAPGFAAEEKIDGQGKYLIPGLSDMHVHITYEPALTDVMPSLFLDYGVTSVRDTGGLLALLQPQIDQWRAAGAIAPRIYFSGPLLDGAKVVYDGYNRPQIGVANATVQSAKRQVARLAAAGVDFIKIYELVSPQVFDALVAAANAYDLPIAAHVPLALEVSMAGPRVDSMEHLRNVELSCAEDAEGLLTERRGRLFESNAVSGYQLRSEIHSHFRPLALAHLKLDSARCRGVIGSLRQTIQVPTLRMNTIARYSPLLRDDWLAVLARLPESVALRWQATAQGYAGKATLSHEEMVDWSLALVGAMQRAGVPIGAGTDTPIGQAIPGYSLHTELERLVQAGLSPLQALSAATVRPAQFLGLQDSHGAIEAGYVADLVILAQDPLTDIRHTRSIAAVISKGQRVR